MRTIAVESGGVTLHVTDAGGEGQPIVLLHGGGRNLGDWNTVGPTLTSLGYRVIAADLRGHGATPAAPWTWELALQDLAAIVADLELHRPAVVGHSLGGMIATLWAGHHPECPLAVNLDGHGNPTRPDQYLGLDPHTAADHNVQVQDVLIGMRGSLDEQMREVMTAIDSLDLPQRYRATLCPLLVTRGTHSMAELLPDEAQAGWRAYEAWLRHELLAAAEATRQLDVVWTDTAHDVHLEAPELVTSLIDQRLAVAADDSDYPPLRQDTIERVLAGADPSSPRAE